jgi:signal transduction histidine kinase
MRLPLPRSFGGQTLAVVVFTLLVSHLIGTTIYWLDRRQAAISTEARDFAERVVGMVVLLQHLPEEWREDVVRESDGRTFHVTLDAKPEAPDQNLHADLSGEVALYLRGRLPPLAPDNILVWLTAAPFVPRGSNVEDRSTIDQAATAPEEDDIHTSIFLHIAIGLQDDRWLNFVGGLPDAPNFWLTPANVYILSIMIGVAGVATWLVFRVNAPLTAFARAADRLGKDIRAEPLPQTGPIEVTQAAHAFNAMQERLRRLVENRTQILAALSHDLKTPVTLLRLRVELMDESEDKLKILETLDEMELMIASVLEFTKATLLNEAPRTVDLSAMLSSICDDMADAGAAVEFETREEIWYSCRRVGLKRALTNLIDNAVKYGGTARVTIAQHGATVQVEIDDDGPGIPQDQQEAIFLPFYRIDESRSEGAGGVGLGLSIAQTIIHGHGGHISLKNRAEGGLRLRVSLPS